MNLLKSTLLCLLFVPPALRAQNPVITKSQLVATSIEQVPVSNIIRSSTADSAVAKIELRNAHYDPAKNNLPYYITSKKTAYNQTAVPSLIIKKTALVTGQPAAVIKRFYSAYLSSSFSPVAMASLCKGENLNIYRIYPFRITPQGEVEELVEFEANWQITANNNAQRMQQVSAFKPKSVLETGSWYKIGTTESGLYKIDAAFLTAAGIDISSIDPRNIRIYGSGGVALPELNSAFRYDDLEENAIQVIGEGDGVFNNTDYILFYAKDKNKWTKNPGYALKFSVQQNMFSDTAFYFITTSLGTGKRVITKPSGGTANVSTDNYSYYNYHEIDAVNFMKSGRQNFGEYFDVTNSYQFTFNEGNFVTGDTLGVEITLAGRGASNTVFNLSGNGINASLVTSAVDLGNSLASYVGVLTDFQRVNNNNSSSIALTVSKQTPGNIGWLDKITVNARRTLVLDRAFCFRDARVSAPGKVCKWTIYNSQNYTPDLWNVTDVITPFIQSYNSSAGIIEFTAPSDSLMEYAIAPNGNYRTPKYVGKVANQNLHGIQQADYVIVTHPLFTSHAQRLANLHQQQEGLSYAIVTTDQVYNEFSSGKPDISGIRDFIRMLYTRNLSVGKEPKYVLLFGDGSYDNKNRNISTNSNLIPTYQSPFSILALNSVATDDFYGLMDPNEGISAEGLGAIDIGIGRIISRSASEAESIVSKIENYYKKDDNFKIADAEPQNCNTGVLESGQGDWKNWMVFLADDEDQATHMNDADQLTKNISSKYPEFNIDKIYLDAYQQFSTPGGQRYPDAYTDLQRRLKKGAIIFNYTGHGGEVGLTAERLVDLETINAWDNFNRLSLFVTATCEFTRYDDPGRTSAGELCLLNPKGGAISLLTTCRLAFSHTNLILNNALYNFMFKTQPNGKKPCLGDIIRGTKDSLSQSLNYANFHLIGDPAITLSYPAERKVQTAKINASVLTPASSDTLGALEKVTISGMVTDVAGNKINDFNGIVYPTVFDKEQTVSGLLNDESSFYSSFGQPFVFKSQKNILYRGKVEVKNGDFSFTFMVPKDISFAYGPGKISYYATNGQQDAAGAYQKVVVGGGSTNAFPDNEGPQVNIYLNDKNFVSGGTTNEKPVLYANLTDSSGINTIGTSIGHDITVVLDGNASKPIVLNDYYEANLNTYQGGTIRYPFEQLSEGPHSLSFKVWDIQNNSNVVTADFVVAPSAELALNHVLNYPNPFTTSTKFFLEHNQACNPLKVTVQVFTISGKLVKTLQRSVTCEGFRPEGIDWDGRDDYGDKLGRGVYIYKVAVLNSDNQRAEKTEKLVILN